MTERPDLVAEAARLKASVSIASIIGETLKLVRKGRHTMGLCPFHGEKTPSFYVYPDHFHCYGCGAHGDVFAWLMRSHGLTFIEAVEHLAGKPLSRKPIGLPTASPSSREGAALNQELARGIWCEAIGARGTPVEAYLQHRGVSLPNAPVIRFHPRCPCERDTRPAMVALMQDPVTGEPCGVHRTFIQPDGSGKAPVQKPKMMLGRAGVVRLDEPLGEGFGLAEGIETALSCMQVLQWGPVWAACSSGGIERFPALASRSLTIFADNDAAGLKAARVCAKRWSDAGRETVIHIAPPGADWNDAAKGLAA